MTTQPPAAAIEPLLLPIAEACRFAGMSRSALDERLGAGEITARKAGKRTLIETASLKALIASLPVATIRPQRKSAAA